MDNGGDMHKADLCTLSARICMRPGSCVVFMAAVTVIWQRSSGGAHLTNLIPFDVCWCLSKMQQSRPTSAGHIVERVTSGLVRHSARHRQVYYDRRQPCVGLFSLSSVYDFVKSFGNAVSEA